MNAILPHWSLLVTSTFINQGNRGFLLLRLQLQVMQLSSAFFYHNPQSFKVDLLTITCSVHHIINSKSTPHPIPPQERKELVCRCQPNTPYYLSLAFRVATCLPRQTTVSILRSLRGTWSFIFGLQAQL